MNRASNAARRTGFALLSVAAMATCSFNAFAGQSIPVSFITRPAIPQSVPLIKASCMTVQKMACADRRNDCVDRAESDNEIGRCDREYERCLADCGGR